MEEIIMEDYERNYKEALKKAEGIIKYYKGCNRDEASIEDLETIFPELKESEDERIRKALVRFHGSTIDIDGIKGSDIVAWLEKQKEQKPTWSEEDERLCSCLIRDQEKALDDVRNDKYGHSEIISDLKEMYRERIDWLKSLKERMKGV